MATIHHWNHWNHSNHPAAHGLIVMLLRMVPVVCAVLADLREVLDSSECRDQSEARRCLLRAARATRNVASGPWVPWESGRGPIS